MIRIKTVTSYLSASALGIIAGLTGYAFWGLGILPALDLVKPEPSIAPLSLSHTHSHWPDINRFGLRRSWRGSCQRSLRDRRRYRGLSDPEARSAAVSAASQWQLVSVARATQSCLVSRSTVNTHALQLFQANAETEANTRLMSGLKLLNTVLPLSEAVVFRCDDSNFLEAVARFKGAAPNSQDPRRNSVWREGIQLCQRAAKTGKLFSETTPGQKSATVAVPLLHEGETAGVLLIRLASEFTADDTALLEAVGSQFARNLERESFANSPARTQSLSFFSHGGGRRKLDALNVLKAVTVEQRCEASTLLHIDDGVAIAYLDGTLALVNPAC